MTFPTEAITTAGSGLVFINTYSASVTDAYRGAIITAEHQLQSLFTNQVTVGVDFDLQSLGKNFSAQNSFADVNVSYAALSNALRAHATTADDLAAVSGLPATDPSGGAGFAIPTTEARILGLAAQSNSRDDSVTLNSDLAFTFGQDAVGAIEHEITEGVFGRTASLGFNGTRWNPLDLFRFTATGQRDFTGGSDGVPTFFGINSASVSSLQFHSSISATGVNDGFDLGDWDHTRGDAFGPGGPGSAGLLSATDLQVLDVLGWNRAGQPGGQFTPAADEFASRVGDTAHPFGQLAIGGTAAGVLQQAGDHDLFAVQLQAGGTYSISEIGHFGGGGTLADPFLRIEDAAGNVLASNDDILDGSNPDSHITFVAGAGGVYYVDAGAFVDGYAGSYKVSIVQTAAGQAASGEVLVGASGGDTLQAGAGNDTLTGGANGANYLRGNEGDDSVSGGAQFDDINGNMGNDTLHGNAGDDWVVGGKDNDVQFGDAGDDIVWGNLGNDTLDGGDGNDQIRGGQGDDVLTGGAGADFLSGDRGSDTITGGAGADIFHTSQDAGVDRVLDFNLAEGDRVMLDPGTTFTVHQAGADTIIDMGPSADGSANQMVLVGVQASTLTGDWIFGA